MTDAFVEDTEGFKRQVFSIAYAWTNAVGYSPCD